MEDYCWASIEGCTVTEGHEMTMWSRSIAGAIGLISALFFAQQSVAQNVASGSIAGEPEGAVGCGTSDPFDVRVALGKAAEGRAEFKAYGSAFDRQVGDHFAQTMQS